VRENVNNEALNASSKVDQTTKRQRQEAASSSVSSAAKDNNKDGSSKLNSGSKESDLREKVDSEAMNAISKVNQTTAKRQRATSSVVPSAAKDDRRVSVDKETGNTGSATAAAKDSLDAIKKVEQQAKSGAVKDGRRLSLVSVDNKGTNATSTAERDATTGSSGRGCLAAIQPLGEKTPEETPEEQQPPTAALQTTRTEGRNDATSSANHHPTTGPSDPSHNPTNQQQLQELQAKYDALLSSSSKSKKMYKSTISKLESTLQTKDQETTCADATLFSLRGRISALHVDLTSITAERDDLAKFKNDHVDSLPHHLSPMNMPEDVSNCSSEIEELQSKMEEVMDQRDSAEEQIKELLGVQLQKDELLLKLQEASMKLSLSERKRRKNIEDYEGREKMARGDAYIKQRRICHLEALLNVVGSQRDRSNSRVRDLLLSGAGCSRGSMWSGTTHNGVQKVLSSFQSENTVLATQFRECQAEVAIIKFEKTDAIKNATKWKSNVSQLQMEVEALQNQNIKLQQRNTFEAAFQSEHSDDCLRELENVQITTQNRLLVDTNSLALNDNHLSDDDFLGPPLPPPLPADASIEEEEGEETKIDELTNTLDSLNEFENFLMDLGLEDEHEHS